MSSYNSKYREKKLLKVGQVVMIKKHLKQMFCPVNIEEVENRAKNNEEYIAAAYVGVNDEMSKHAGNIMHVSKLMLNSTEIFDAVELREDKKRFTWTYDMFEAPFRFGEEYITTSGLKLLLSSDGECLVYGDIKIKTSDYDLFFEHKNIKSLSMTGSCSMFKA